MGSDVPTGGPIVDIRVVNFRWTEWATPDFHSHAMETIARESYRIQILREGGEWTNVSVVEVVGPPPGTAVQGPAHEN